ncbi:hypothetical protein DMB42_11185 [Nonomuraea sp. WAC 01424]|uniref:hypothetical protein n=1 Tax=Nonomuraea sp. WAC 01424 TaxID=2203200 RepID=UPI000F7A5884|nr:hypothetical protein [Nonomuraea sp. WAC 01424]RSN12742.1 hypothetical protein DMB42_11185 [Nonomuraea sp. WAC 01424]
MKPGIILYGLLAATLAGCAGGGADNVVDAHAMAELREVLNRRPSLPDGFAQRPEQAWRVPFGRLDKNCGSALDAAAGHAPQEGLTGQAAVSYQGDGLGERAGLVLARYAGDEAETSFDALSDGLESCREIRVAGGTDLRARRLDIGDAGRSGDEVVGTRLRGRLNGYPYALDVVLSRTGDTLVSVVHAGMTDVDRDRTKKLVAAVLSMSTA